MAQKGLIDEKPIRYNQVGRVSCKASGIKTILSNLDEFKTVFKYSQFGFGCVEVMIRRIAKYFQNGLISFIFIIVSRKLDHWK